MSVSALRAKFENSAAPAAAPAAQGRLATSARPAARQVIEIPQSEDAITAVFNEFAATLDEAIKKDLPLSKTTQKAAILALDAEKNVKRGIGTIPSNLLKAIMLTTATLKTQLNIK